MNEPSILLTAADLVWVRTHSGAAFGVFSCNARECWPATGHGWSRPPQRRTLDGLPCAVRACVDLVLRQDPRGKRFILDLDAGRLVLADGQRPIARLTVAATAVAS